MLDLEKLAVILAARPIAGLRKSEHVFDGGNYIVISEARWFDPFNSIDQAMMLLEGLSYEIRITDDECTCGIYDGEGRMSFLECSTNTARAITEAVYQYVEATNAKRP